jgi:hypothetical protein
MPSLEHSYVRSIPMPAFRALLKERGYSCDQLALAELERSAKFLVEYQLNLTRAKPLRPSHLARELKALTKSLTRAERAMARMGQQGMLHLFAASHANRDADILDALPHLEYISRMARWADRAATTAAEISRSSRDDEGGRQGDDALRRLVVLLMKRYQELLSIRPEHTVNPQTGLGESFFDIFIKMAIQTFAPQGVTVEPRKIDDATRWALASRDDEFFLPPKLPSGSVQE